MLCVVAHCMASRERAFAKRKYKTTVLRPSSRGRGETGGRAYGGGFWNPGTTQVPLSSALLSIVVYAR